MQHLMVTYHTLVIHLAGTFAPPANSTQAATNFFGSGFGGAIQVLLGDILAPLVVVFGFLMFAFTAFIKKQMSQGLKVLVGSLVIGGFCLGASAVTGVLAGTGQNVITAVVTSIGKFFGA